MYKTAVPPALGQTDEKVYSIEISEINNNSSPVLYWNAENNNNEVLELTLTLSDLAGNSENLIDFQKQPFNYIYVDPPSAQRGFGIKNCAQTYMFMVEATATDDFVVYIEPNSVSTDSSISIFLLNTAITLQGGNLYMVYVNLRDFENFIFENYDNEFALLAKPNFLSFVILA